MAGALCGPHHRIPSRSRVEPDAMREVAYSSDFQDQTTGIFGTGASYDRVDSVQWVPVKDPETWLVWEEEMEKHSA